MKKMSKMTFLQFWKKLSKFKCKLHLDPNPDPATQINSDSDSKPCVFYSLIIIRIIVSSSFNCTYTVVIGLGLTIFSHAMKLWSAAIFFRFRLLSSCRAFIWIFLFFSSFFTLFPYSFSFNCYGAVVNNLSLLLGALDYMEFTRTLFS